MRGRDDRRPRSQEIPFAEACSLVESALTGSFRHAIADEASAAPTLGSALLRLRDAMRGNLFRSGPASVRLQQLVGAYERRTRGDGFHALHDWDGVSDRVNENTIPIDVLDYLIRERGAHPAHAGTLGIILDYHFLYVLALLSLRIWDDGEADENLERLDLLLQKLQGADGSGQQFVADAETLILLATSHYEIEERGFGYLLDRVQTLNVRHRTRIALGHAVSLGCHLRFGFEASYGRDIAAMRNDNVADYPWLSFSLATLMDGYVRQDSQNADASRDTLAEAILNGLSPDAPAFARGTFAEQLEASRHDLLDAFERLRPADDRYSPLSFFFNFSQNVIKGIVVDALLWGEPSSVRLNDLFTEQPPDAAAAAKTAVTLMGYAKANPARIAGRAMPAVVYDPGAGRRAFAATMRALKR